MVRAGHWFGSDVPDGDFALVGCTVSPGFEYGEFELADCAVLTARWPQHEALIARLTPQGDGP